MTTQDEGFDSLDAILMEPTSPVGTLSDALAFANEWDVAFVEDWDVEPLSLGFTMLSDSDEVQTPQAAETPPTDTGASISREPVYKTLAPRMSVEGLKMGRPAPVDPSTIKRMTRREEIVYLRSAAVELENQLAQLQEEECEPSSNVWSLWQDVASRQREVRRRAEAENTKLRGMLEEFFCATEGLERVIRERNSVVGTLCGGMESSGYDRRGTLASASASLQSYSKRRGKYHNGLQNKHSRATTPSKTGS